MVIDPSNYTSTFDPVYNQDIDFNFGNRQINRLGSEDTALGRLTGNYLDASFLPYESQQDQRYHNQSNLNVLGNFASRLGYSTFILGATGIMSGAETLAKIISSPIHDADITRGGMFQNLHSSAEELARDWFPLMQSEEFLKEEDVFKKMLHPGQFLTSQTDSLGFVLQMITGSALLKSTNLSGVLVDRFAKAANLYPVNTKVGQALQALDKAGAVSKLDDVLSMALLNPVEAGGEANETIEETVNQLVEGRLAGKNQYTDQEIVAKAKRAGQAVFNTNMVLSSFTNLIPFSLVKRAMPKKLKGEYGIAFDTVAGAFKVDSSKNPFVNFLFDKGNVKGMYTKEILKNIFNEATEESLQYSISKANEVIDGKLDTKNTLQTLAALGKDLVTGEFLNFNDLERRENLVTGALFGVGGLAGAETIVPLLGKAGSKLPFESIGNRARDYKKTQQDFAANANKAWTDFHGANFVFKDPDKKGKLSTEADKFYVQYEGQEKVEIPESTFSEIRGKVEMNENGTDFIERGKVRLDDNGNPVFDRDAFIKAVSDMKAVAELEDLADAQSKAGIQDDLMERMYAYQQLAILVNAAKQSDSVEALKKGFQHVFSINGETRTKYNYLNFADDSQMKEFSEMFLPMIDRLDKAIDATNNSLINTGLFYSDDEKVLEFRREQALNAALKTTIFDSLYESAVRESEKLKADILDTLDSVDIDAHQAGEESLNKIEKLIYKQEQVKQVLEELASNGVYGSEIKASERRNVILKHLAKLRQDLSKQLEELTDADLQTVGMTKEEVANMDIHEDTSRVPYTDIYYPVSSLTKLKSAQYFKARNQQAYFESTRGELAQVFDNMVNKPNKKELEEAVKNKTIGKYLRTSFSAPKHLIYHENLSFDEVDEFLKRRAKRIIQEVKAKISKSQMVSHAVQLLLNEWHGYTLNPPASIVTAGNVSKKINAFKEDIKGLLEILKENRIFISEANFEYLTTAAEQLIQSYTDIYLEPRKEELASAEFFQNLTPDEQQQWLDAIDFDPSESEDSSILKAFREIREALAEMPTGEVDYSIPTIKEAIEQAKQELLRPAYGLIDAYTDINGDPLDDVFDKGPLSKEKLKLELLKKAIEGKPEMSKLENDIDSALNKLREIEKQIDKNITNQSQKDFKQLALQFNSLVQYVDISPFEAKHKAAVKAIEDNDQIGVLEKMMLVLTYLDENNLMTNEVKKDFYDIVHAALLRADARIATLFHSDPVKSKEVLMEVIESPVRALHILISKLNLSNGSKILEDFGETYDVVELVESLNKNQANLSANEKLVFSLLNTFSLVEGFNFGFDFSHSPISLKEVFASLVAKVTQAKATNGPIPNFGQIRAAIQIAATLSVKQPNGVFKNSVIFRAPAGAGKSLFIAPLVLDILGYEPEQIATSSPQKFAADNIAKSLSSPNAYSIQELIDSLNSDKIPDKVELLIIDEIGTAKPAVLMQLGVAIAAFNSRNSRKRKTLKAFYLYDSSQFTTNNDIAPLDYHNSVGKHKKLSEEDQTRANAGDNTQTLNGNAIDYTHRLREVPSIFTTYRSEVPEVLLLQTLFRRSELPPELFTTANTELHNPVDLEGTASGTTQELIATVNKSKAINPNRTRLIIVGGAAKKARYEGKVPADVKVVTVDEVIGISVDEVYTDIEQKDNPFLFTDIRTQGINKAFKKYYYTAISRARKFVFVANYPNSTHSTSTARNITQQTVIPYDEISDLFTSIQNMVGAIKGEGDDDSGNTPPAAGPTPPTAPSSTPTPPANTPTPPVTTPATPPPATPSATTDDEDREPTEEESILSEIERAQSDVESIKKRKAANEKELEKEGLSDEDKNDLNNKIESDEDTISQYTNKLQELNRDLNHERRTTESYTQLASLDKAIADSKAKGNPADAKNFAKILAPEPFSDLPPDIAKLVEDGTIEYFCEK